MAEDIEIQLNNEMVNGRLELYEHKKGGIIGTITLDVSRDLLREDNINFSFTKCGTTLTGYATIQRKQDKASASHLKNNEPCVFDITYVNYAQDVCWESEK